MSDQLSLNWGTLKGWDFSNNEAAQAAFKRYFEAGKVAAGAMMQDDTPEQKQAICDMIDAVDCEIFNEWEGSYMTKEAAKSYVLNYGKGS